MRSASKAVPTLSSSSGSPGKVIHSDSAALNYVRKEQRLERESLLLPRENSRAEHAIAVFTLMLFFGAFYVGPLIFNISVCYAVVFRSASAAALAAFLLVDFVFPAGKVASRTLYPLVYARGSFFEIKLNVDAQAWPAFRHWVLWDIWRRYFRTTIVLPEPPFLDESRCYLMAQFPHAAFPMAGFLTPALAGEEGTGVPGPATGVIASILLSVPFFKHVFAWSACHAATQSVLLKLLKGPGVVGMIPEGVAGIFEGATAERERVFVRSRKGFVRVAIMAGTDIIPVYHFGNSQLIRYVGSEFLSRKLRTTIGIFWGQYGVVPHPQHLITALGHPVKVTQSDNPTKEEIEETHARFLIALNSLYYQHRHLSGWQDRELELT